MAARVFPVVFIPTVKVTLSPETPFVAEGVAQVLFPSRDHSPEEVTVTSVVFGWKSTTSDSGLREIELSLTSSCF